MCYALADIGLHTEWTCKTKLHEHWILTLQAGVIEPHNLPEGLCNNMLSSWKLPTPQQKNFYACRRSRVQARSNPGTGDQGGRCTTCI